MAEDGDPEADTRAEEDEYQVGRRINNQANQSKNQKAACRTRFDFLAIPSKRAILDVYQNHSYHFPKEKADRLKHTVQELFAMTPEETEKYFEQIRAEANEIARQKMMKIMLRRLYRKQQHEKQEKKAFRLVERLLRRGMLHAFTNPVPPLISVRLRNLSDIILEQICDLRNVDMPDRELADQTGQFLIAVSDWVAIAMEHVYYGVQLKKNQDLEEIEQQEKEKEEKEDEGKKGKGKKSEAEPVSEKDSEKQESLKDELELEEVE